MLLHRFIRRNIHPVIVRIYVDGRFDIFPADKPNLPGINDYLKKMLEKGIAEAAEGEIEPGDYTFSISGHEDGQTVFDLVPR